MDPAAHFMKVPSFGTLERADCALCGGSETVEVTCQEVFGEMFHVVKCASCGLIRTNPRPTEQWKQHFYDPEWNGYAESKGRDFIYAPDLTRLSGYRKLLEFLTKHCAEGAKLLDVGCAAGLFVAEARKRGFLAAGCDYSAQAVSHGKEQFNIHIIHSPAECIDAPADSFDVVTLLHVFEHLPEPLVVLKELRRVLRPGGFLLLETVNYRPHFQIEKNFPFLIPLYNAVTQRNGLPWVPFDHLYHWSPETLHLALERAGFHDVRLHYIRGYRSEMKPNAGFGMVYALLESLAKTARMVSAGRWDFWPVLLASGRK